MVQRYNPDYVMHAARFAPFARENEHGEFVKFSDYEVLKAERDALADRVERLSGMLTESRVATKSAEERADALAVENAELKAAAADLRRQAFNGRRNSHNCGPFQYSDLCESIIEATKVETPATDAALAAIRDEATARALKHLCDCQLISATVAELKADELREAK